MVDRTDLLHSLIDQFISGHDRSKKNAAEIEVLIEELFSGEDYAAGVVIEMALYNPAGGDYTRNEHEIAERLIWLKEWMGSGDMILNWFAWFGGHDT